MDYVADDDVADDDVAEDDADDDAAAACRCASRSCSFCAASISPRMNEFIVLINVCSFIRNRSEHSWIYVSRVI